jgi:hypothetical protein
MTHADAIARLFALRADGDATRPSAAERAATIAHVARCSDCWETLASLHDDVAAEPARERAVMTARFGCEPVRDMLFALVDLDPAMIAREQPGVARHLGWCLACRTRLAEIIAVERELATGPGWVDVRERVREAVGRLVIRVGRTVAGLVEIPDVFVLGPAAVAVPVRGVAAPDALPASARFALDDTGIEGEIAVEPGETGFSLRLTGDVTEPLSVHVREVRPEGEALIARYTMRGSEPVRIRGLWPGAFLLELHGRDGAQVHRVRLDVGSGE